MYSSSSMTDGGMLYQLHNLNQCRNVVNHPKNSFTACEDFFLLITEAHVVAAALEVFKMSDIEGTPSNELFPDGSYDLDSFERRNVMMLAIANLVNQLVDISFGEEKSLKKKKKKKQRSETICDEDKVNAYACGLLTHGLVYRNFVMPLKKEMEIELYDAEDILCFFFKKPSELTILPKRSRC